MTEYTPQAKEFLARQELQKMLSDKGKKLIWGIDNIKEQDGKTIYTFDAQPKISFKLQVLI
jgi:hypothetical protein